MRPFNELQEEICTKSKAAGACADQYRRACKATSEAELLVVIKDNLNWCIENKVISHEYFAGFTPEIYLASGIANTGLDNTGFANSGNSNSGNSNSGYRNSGDRNSGDSNSGDGHTGAEGAGMADFHLFNKPSGMTYEEFRSSRVFDLLCNVTTTMWIPASQMTEEEKQSHPHWETTEGYLKAIPFKQSFQDAWHNWSDENRAAFTALPNFDANIFFEITGVDLIQK